MGIEQKLFNFAAVMFSVKWACYTSCIFSLFEKILYVNGFTDNQFVSDIEKLNISEEFFFQVLND